MNVSSILNIFFLQIITLTGPNMPLNFVMSERGKQPLVHDGETFNLNRHNKTTSKSNWRCLMKPCKTSVATIADEIVSIKHSMRGRSKKKELNAQKF